VKVGGRVGVLLVLPRPVRFDMDAQAFRLARAPKGLGTPLSWV
jgi:hypothetical protein